MAINKKSFLSKIKEGIEIVKRPFRLTDIETKEFNKVVARPRQVKIRKGSTQDQLAAMNDTIMKRIISKRKK